MRPAAIWSLIAGLGLLTLVGMLRATDEREETPTTFGVTPDGYRGMFDLLSELGFPVTRTSDGGERLDPHATVWWIAPRELCAPPASSGAVGAAGAEWPGGDWLERGGTALVLLSSEAGSVVTCPPIHGLSMPARMPGRTAPPTSTPSVTPARAVVRGDLTPRERTLETPHLLAFVEAGTWDTRATLDDRPFVLEHAVGNGRLVLVADAAFLGNSRLDQHDAAPLVVDLVRAFGTPLVHERATPPRDRGAVLYLAGSPALAVFLGLATVGLLFTWQGSAVPPRSLGEVEVAAPSLDAFVDSLAALYAATRDHARVLERYRELTAARLRGHFRLPPDTPLAVVVDRLPRERGSPAAVDLLLNGVPVPDEPALREAVRALDLLVREAAQ